MKKLIKPKVKNVKDLKPGDIIYLQSGIKVYLRIKDFLFPDTNIGKTHDFSYLKTNLINQIINCCKNAVRVHAVTYSYNFFSKILNKERFPQNKFDQLIKVFFEEEVPELPNVTVSPGFYIVTKIRSPYRTIAQEKIMEVDCLAVDKNLKIVDTQKIVSFGKCKNHTLGIDVLWLYGNKKLLQKIPNRQLQNPKSKLNTKSLYIPEKHDTSGDIF